MHIELIFHNIGYVVSALTTLAIAIVVLFKSQDRALKTVFFLLSIALLGFELSHLLGTNAPDAQTANLIFWFNLSNIFVIIFDVHFIFLALGIAREKMWQLIGIYAAGISLCAYYILNPLKFLLTPEPKLYLPFYYNPGELYYLMVGFIVFGFLLIVYHLMTQYYISTDHMHRLRIKYYLLGHIVGYIIGISAQGLNFGFPINPLWSSFIGAYTFFFAYAAIKYELFEIKVLAKRAAAYAFFALVCGLSITLISYLNIWIVTEVPDYPSWIVPVFSGLIALGVGEYVWVKIKEVDRLKYEFINVVSHKFRTPLTYITWAMDSADTAHTKDEMITAMKQVKMANARLTELTDTLISAANAHDRSYMYSFQKAPLEPIVKKVIRSHEAELKEKGITVGMTVQPHVPDVFVDIKKIEYAIDILVENAIVYNKDHGHIEIYIVQHGKYVELQIRDTGIGINKENLPHIFNTFFRTHTATNADTEGMGLGLYLAKSIVDRHHGEITANSSGNGKGSLFTIVFKKRT